MARGTCDAPNCNERATIFEEGFVKWEWCPVHGAHLAHALNPDMSRNPSIAGCTGTQTRCGGLTFDMTVPSLKKET